MSAKKSVNVVIGDKLYTLSGYEEKEYLEQVASYINGKIDENGAIDKGLKDGQRILDTYINNTLK